jgi:asparagine synthase (glutamine-hydrolysing)
MCGIAGLVSRGKLSGSEAMPVVRRMTDALAHRGPDGQGVAEAVGASVNDAVVVFGHRRLAIIDLTERAAQPMASPRVSVTVTFNGEIYNFRELRRELESYGRRFASDSDTEVLLQGYEQWGSGVVGKLRGMFAFAIADARSSSVLLARDRLGIKPLYVSESTDGLIFASEVRALLVSGLVARRLDVEALDLFLCHQTVPTPRTLVRDVKLIPPGCVGVWTRSRGLAVDPYWDLLGTVRSDARTVVRREDARATVGALMADAVRSHLVSDVPVGLFLSGGIDSTALVALASRAGIAPRTFTVTFPGTSFDEGRYARAVAEAFGADHTELPLSDDDLQSQIPTALDAMDHPSGDGVNTHIVSRAVRAAGIKVALSGLGGDEFFGGYPSFQRQQTLSRLAPLYKAPRSVRQLAAVATRAMGQSSVSAVKAAAILESDGTLAETFPVMRQMFSREQRRQLLDTAPSSQPDPYVQLLQDATRRVPEADDMACVSFAEARTYMHDVLLRDTDQMSMRHGLEVRVPLLDHPLVEYVMGLPASIKRGAGGPKSLLVDSLGVPLPDETLRPKQGFVLPFDIWMRDSLRGMCEHYLGADGLLRLGVFREQEVRSLWRSFLAKDGQVSWSRPWTLVALAAWAERTGVTA